MFIAILFCLPADSPFSWKLFNYTPIAVGAVLVLAGGWYLISARKWFKGPRSRARPRSSAEIERDLELLA